MHTRATRSAPSPAPGGKPRILHLTISFERGGRRDAISSLSRGLRALGCASHLATLRGDPAEMERFRDDFDGTRRLGISGLPSREQLRQLRQICRDNAIDIVHAHDAASQFVASRLRGVASSPHTVMTFHRSLSFESAGIRNKLRNAISLTRTDRVMTASAERRAHFISENWYPSRRVSVVPLGIDTVRFSPDPAARAAIREELGIGADTPLILSMGHYGSEKGVDQVLAAFGILSSSFGEGGASPRLAVLGTGSPERVEEIARLAGETAPERIALLGQRPDPERWLAAADLMFHLPRIEAFGLAVVQAMACGVPVVAARVGGIPELIRDGETGCLVPPEAPRTVADRALELLADRALGARIGESARRAALDNYTAAGYAERQLKVYLEVLGGTHFPTGH